MISWSGMRKKLETEYLAEALQGRVRYFVTRYSKSHDQEGRAAILVDGKEVLQGNYYFFTSKKHLLPKDVSKYSIGNEHEVNLGMFDQSVFFDSFMEFDNQAIEKSLESDNLLVRIFAVLDRRVGKRRLTAMKENIQEQPEVFQYFFVLRAKAEGIL